MSRDKVEELENKVKELLKRLNKFEDIESKTMMRTLVEVIKQVSQSVVITDINGSIEYVNPRFESLTGYSLEELKSKNPRILKYKSYDEETIKDKELFENLWKTIKSKKSWRGVFKNKKKDGTLYYEKAIIFPLLDGEGNIIKYAGIKDDITREKRLEEEERKLLKLKAIGNLAGGIAHDFNNILTGVFGNISMAKDEVSKDSSIYENLKHAENAISRAIRLTKKLLTFSDGGSPIKENVVLNGMLRKVVKLSLISSEINPIFRFSKKTWPVSIDKNLMYQVFFNLINNVKEAMPNGGNLYVDLKNVKLAKNNKYEIDAGKYVKAVIRDEGFGIKEIHLDKIFEPYFSTKENSHGLGLAVAYSIIKEHSAFIDIKSKENEGCTVTIHIPAVNKPILKDDFIYKNHKALEKKYLSKKRRILIMDDETIICRLLKNMFLKMNFDSVTVNDGETAIIEYQKSINEKKYFDIVIMDLTIPHGMGAKETIKDILELDEDAKVIVSSGYSSDNVMTNYKDYGFYDVLSKPYTMDELRRLLLKIFMKEN